MNNLLTIRNITKTFGGLVAVNNVSIEVKEQTFTMLIGPNGCGKTTLINCCTGILEPTAGNVFLGDKDITGWPTHKITEVGFVRSFQIPLPFLGLTVLDNVIGAMRNSGEAPLRSTFKRLWVEEEEENVERAMAILRRVYLEKHWNKPSHALGAAQLKMLEVAKGLASGAKLIALDEPIGGVDPASADEILSHVSELKREGLTFLVVEHRIDIAAPYADYIFAMELGRLISQGTPQQVLNDPKVIEVYLGKGAEAC
ncbi:MAG: ABC transporter ATP-binding protein [Syntrophomonadaceae bacterium]|nr:ABC transporter ATP-binding protein [Syntrophomonadaceae bacterium]